jgi:hypothetical protein
MHWIEVAVQASCIALEIGVIACLWRLGGWRDVPIFSAYLVFILLRTVIGSVALSSPRFYFEFYWISAPLEIVFTVLAVLESFWRIFRSFRLLRWFRFVLPAAVVGALVYSAWRGYHYGRFPLVEMTPAAAALVSAMVMSHYAILSVSVLYFSLARLLHVAGRVYEDLFILGFGVASLAAAFGGSLRGTFGEGFALISREAQPIGYLIALLLWLSAVVHPTSDKPVVASFPQDSLSDLKFQLRNLRSFVRKGAR